MSAAKTTAYKVKTINRRRREKVKRYGYFKEASDNTNTIPINSYRRRAVDSNRACRHALAMLPSKSLTAMISWHFIMRNGPRAIGRNLLKLAQTYLA